MYDLVNLYHDVLDALDAPRVSVVGCSFGGWIAAELAVAGARKIDRLVLVDPVGIKIGGREERDIVHFFNTDPAELNRRAWHDPARRPEGVYGLGWHATIDDAMSDAEMITLARNWDSLCLYGWKPHMFNPQLAWWLRRIAAPTLVLWGASDRIVTPEYGQNYAQRIPGAEFRIIEAAGHHPELEQPRAFVDHVAAFLGA
jgi:pimeloyl-ACP methyl ester carboxylesterase